MLKYQLKHFMDIILHLFFPLIISIFIFFSIKPLITYLNKKNILDVPQKRSNHRRPTPKGAGLIIIPTIIVSIVFFIKLDLIKSDPWLILSLLTIVFFITSIIDDILNLPSSPRLLIHSLCVLIAITSLENDIVDFVSGYNSQLKLGINNESLTLIFKCFLFLYWLWLVNLFNFMDGMDGITASQTFTFSAGIVLLSIYGSLPSQYSYIGLIIFSSFVGFLFWNMPPAKIFLGDSGSIPLGFLISSIIIINLINQQNFVPSIILILYYFLDSTLTLIIRIIKRKNVFEAHSEHFYQKKIRSGNNHLKVLKKINIVNISLLIFSLLYVKYKILSLVLSFTLVFILLNWLNKKNDL